MTHERCERCVAICRPEGSGGRASENPRRDGAEVVGTQSHIDRASALFRSKLEIAAWAEARHYGTFGRLAPFPGWSHKEGAKSQMRPVRNRRPAAGGPGKR